MMFLEPEKGGRGENSLIMEEFSPAPVRRARTVLQVQAAGTNFSVPWVACPPKADLLFWSKWAKTVVHGFRALRGYS
jgi:hypothetical protein